MNCRGKKNTDVQNGCKVHEHTFSFDWLLIAVVWSCFLFVAPVHGITNRSNVFTMLAMLAVRAGVGIFLRKGRCCYGFLLLIGGYFWLSSMLRYLEAIRLCRFSRKHCYTNRTLYSILPPYTYTHTYTFGNISKRAPPSRGPVVDSIITAT